MRKREVVLFFVMGSFLLSGCHTTNQDIQQNTDSTASESTSATEIDTSAMFSDRDKEVGYEEEALESKIESVQALNQEQTDPQSAYPKYRCFVGGQGIFL